MAKLKFIPPESEVFLVDLTHSILAASDVDSINGTSLPQLSRDTDTLDWDD